MYYGTGTPIVQDHERELAMLLKTIVVVQGGNNILLSSSRCESNSRVHNFGNKIPFIVEALVLIVARSLIGLVILWTSYALQLRSKDIMRNEAAKHMPDPVVA